MDNYQKMWWSIPDHRSKAKIYNAPETSTDRCVDVKIDWHIPDTVVMGVQIHNHYDARVLRNCQQGAAITSDPSNYPNFGNGDTWWDEPSGWDGPNATRVREVVVAYMIDDDTLEVLYDSAQVDPAWLYQESNDNTVYNTPGDVAPVTQTKWWALVYTLYQDGTVAWSTNEAKPRTCPTKPEDC